MNNFNNYVKKNLGVIILLIILIISFLTHRVITPIIVYILFIKLLMSKYIKGNVKTVLKLIIWISCFVFFILTFYLNRYMLNNSCYWFEFLREYGLFLSMALVFAGIVLDEKDKVSKND